jgi:hypothetical protein
MIVLAANSSPVLVGKAIAAVTQKPAHTETAYNDGFFRQMLLSQTDQSSADSAATSRVSAASIASADITASTASIAAATSSTISSDETVAGSEPTTTPPTISRKELRGALIPQFVRVDVKYITYYHLEGKDTEYAYAYDNLRNRILSIFTALGIAPADQFLAATKDGTHSLQALSTLIVHLQHNTPSRVSTNQQKTLSTLLAIINKLQSQKYGSLAGQ